MKLKIFTEEGLELLKHNIKSNVENYNKPTNDWIYNFLGEGDYIREFKTKVPKFELITAGKDISKSKADIENVKILYSNLKFLTREQAADERLWVGFSHLNFWEFMYKRWNVLDEKMSELNINNRYFLEVNKGLKRGLLDNTLSKYWWMGKMFYEQKEKDPFHLLNFFEVDYSTQSHNLFSSNYSSNKNLAKNIVRSLYKIEKEREKRITRSEYRDIMRYLNILGGIIVLDCLSKEELDFRIRNRLKLRLAY